MIFFVLINKTIIQQKTQIEKNTGITPSKPQQDTISFLSLHFDHNYKKHRSKRVRVLHRKTPVTQIIEDLPLFLALIILKNTENKKVLTSKVSTLTVLVL